MEFAVITTDYIKERINNRNFGSSMDKIEQRIVKDIEKTIAAFDNLQSAIIYKNHKKS